MTSRIILPFVVLSVFATDADTKPRKLSRLERAIVEHAATECPGVSSGVDRELLRDLLRMEQTVGVPTGLRGMVLAAACMETKYDHTMLGDWYKGEPRAVGILQQHEWVEKFYRIDRKNPRQAARAWLKHIVTRVPKVAKLCPDLSGRKLWIAAWVTAIRAPSKKPRCLQRPLHWTLLKRWRGNWAHLSHGKKDR